MGLIVKKPVTAKEGYTIATDAYVRISGNLDLTGSAIACNALVFINKASFDAGLSSVKVNEVETSGWIIPYDRAADGVDILLFTLTKVKETLISANDGWLDSDVEIETMV